MSIMISLRGTSQVTFRRASGDNVPAGSAIHHCPDRRRSPIFVSIFVPIIIDDDQDKDRDDEEDRRGS